MSKRGSAVHVSIHRRHYTGKDGTERVYQTHLLRRSYRQDGKVKNQTVANLSHLPAETIEVIRASLAGEVLVKASAAATVTRSVPHGHVAAVWAQARALGLPALLGPASRSRDLAMALIIARVVRPASKLATTSWWADTTLGVDLGVAGAGTDETYAAMDWLLARQDGIEAKLAARHLASGPTAVHHGRRPASLDPRAAPRLPACHRCTEGRLIAMTWIPDDPSLDPRHVFLDASHVMRRYGWGKTKGYQNLKDRELVPPPVMTHPDRWRLDQLLDWEEKRMALAEAALEALIAPDREAPTVTDLLPQPKRRRRSA